jgi:hypothetical protein
VLSVVSYFSLFFHKTFDITLLNIVIDKYFNLWQEGMKKDKEDNYAGGVRRGICPQQKVFRIS